MEDYTDHLVWGAFIRTRRQDLVEALEDIKKRDALLGYEAEPDEVKDQLLRDCATWVHTKWLHGSASYATYLASKFFLERWKAAHPKPPPDMLQVVDRVCSTIGKRFYAPSYLIRGHPIPGGDKVARILKELAPYKDDMLSITRKRLRESLEACAVRVQAYADKFKDEEPQPKDITPEPPKLGD
jgi:hypothetical protein